MNDRVSDLLARIRNAQLRKAKELSMPSSNMLVAIVEILKKEGFVEDLKVETDKEGAKILTVKLKYDEGRGAIVGLRRISKPGIRRYLGYRDIRKVLGGLGITIISTPKGVMTGQMARKERVGGELLCEIW